MDDVLNDPDITKKEVKKIVKAIKKAKDKSKKQVMERVGLKDDREGRMHWCGLECNDTSPEKRKKNVLG